MRIKRLSFLAVIAMLAACGNEAPGDGPGPFSEAKGVTYQPGCSAPVQQLVRNTAAWTSFWTQTHPGGEPVPAVDFGNASVLAVCAAISSPAHGYEITAYEPQPGGGVTAHVTAVEPGAGCVYPAVVAHAFHAIKLDGVFSADFQQATAVREACAALGADYGWETLALGQSSACTEPLETVIRTEQAWADFWSSLHATSDPQPERPAVDFASESVIATCLGTRPNGGYATFIVHLTPPDEAGHVAVGTQDLEPGPRCAVTEAVTNPYHVIRVNRVLTGATFRRKASVLDC